ncbi:hypothetical protein SXCC_01760 [Gluconacetobacter sp. SXCC-1]|nr:hypothetical protein SXCC_01760 [Gluconacetobacter sp. SXCC-1]
MAGLRRGKTYALKRPDTATALSGRGHLVSTVMNRPGRTGLPGMNRPLATACLVPSTLYTGMTTSHD